MLCLLFNIGDDYYALDSSQIAVVLPAAPCKQVPQAPAWVHGLYSYRGRNVPVLDMSLLASGRPAAARLSTRLVLLHYTAPALPAQAPRLLGLLLEKAVQTLRCERADFHSSGLVHEPARYLGPVLQHEGRMIQLVQVDDLLDAPVQALLFPQEQPA